MAVAVWLGAGVRDRLTGIAVSASTNTGFLVGCYEEGGAVTLLSCAGPHQEIDELLPRPLLRIGVFLVATDSLLPEVLLSTHRQAHRNLWDSLPINTDRVARPVVFAILVGDATPVILLVNRDAAANTPAPQAPVSIVDNDAFNENFVLLHCKMQLPVAFFDSEHKKLNSSF